MIEISKEIKPYTNFEETNIRYILERDTCNPKQLVNFMFSQLSYIQVRQIFKLLYDKVMNNDIFEEGEE